MADAAPGVPVPPPKRSGAGTAGGAGWLPAWSPQAAVRAIRAAVVVSGVFALADQVIGNRQMATFAAFGGFATLVLSTFSGNRREKLLAHAGLAVAGSVLLTIGTAVNSSTALAACVTVLVTFAVFFAGAAGPNAAAGVTGALLSYVLPAASPGTVSMIGDRLAGWWLASAAGTAAVLLFAERPGIDRLRAALAKLSATLADELAAALEGAATEEQLAACIAAKHELMTQFTSTPYRPTGLTAPDQALANGVEALEWCAALVLDTVRECPDLRRASPADRELLRAASTMLGAVARLFAGGGERPDLARLERCRARSRDGLGEVASADSQEIARLSFHANTIAAAVFALASEALIASGLDDPEQTPRASAPSDRRVPAAAPRAARRVSDLVAVARRDANLRSVWFINSVRGAVALAVAVAIADLSSVQHGFWVVLGTLSVLRTSAAATGSTALRALAGTVVGFVIGGVLMLAIGSSSAVLWAALPIAVFVAAYAPGTAPFAVGQAAFTVTIVVLFNLLMPVGWKVGVLRVEDVALGCAVSVVVGSMFWPRGLASVVGDDLADAFRSGASYLTQAVQWACGTRALEPDGERATTTAALRLDDALRAFLAEQGTKHIEKQQLWRLVGGALRLRLTAHAIAGLPCDATDAGGTSEVLGRRADALAEWYERLAERLGKPRRQPLAPLEVPAFAGELDVSSAERSTDRSSGSLYEIWLCEHLDHLGGHLEALLMPSARIAEIRRRPWWR